MEDSMKGLEGVMGWMKADKRGIRSREKTEERGIINRRGSGEEGLEFKKKRTR